MLSLFLTFCFITWLQLEATKKKLYVDVGMTDKTILWHTTDGVSEKSTIKGVSEIVWH